MGWVRRLRSLPAWRQLVYIVAIVAAFVLLVWDIVDKEARFTTVAFFALVAIAAVALRAPDRRA